MKALVYTAERELTYRDEPPPRRAPGEALVAIASAGICGSDMHAYLGHDPRRVPPLILGHEAAGHVLEGELAGRAVALNPLISCGRCLECIGGRQNLCAQRELIGMVRPGAFAEQVSIPESNLLPLPPGMRTEHAALCEPGATALHAVLLAEKNMARPISEARARVLGGGSVGLLCALILLDKGAAEVHLGEPNTLRRASAADAIAGVVGGYNGDGDRNRDGNGDSDSDRDNGGNGNRGGDSDGNVDGNGNRGSNGDNVHRAFDPLTAPPPEMHYDVIFDAVGNAHTRRAAVASAKSGAVIAHIGLQDADGGLDVRAMTLREITFIGCYTYSPADLRAVLRKLHSGALGDLDWLEQRPLANGARAFADLLAGECAAAKVVLTL